MTRTDAGYVDSTKTRIKTSTEAEEAGKIPTMKIKKFKKHLDNMTAEETLEFLQSILKKVEVHEEFVDGPQGVIVGSTLSFVCEDKVLSSAMNEFDWPMTYMPMPEAFKGKLN